MTVETNVVRVESEVSPMSDLKIFNYIIALKMLSTMNTISLPFNCIPCTASFF